MLLKCGRLPFKCFTGFNDIWAYFHVYLILLYRICSQSLGNDQNMAWFTWCSSYGLGRHGFRQGVVAQQHLREVAISKAACFPYSYLLGNLEWAKCSGVPQQCDSGRCACDTHQSGCIIGLPCRVKYLCNIMPQEWFLKSSSYSMKMTSLLTCFKQNINPNGLKCLICAYHF